MKYVNISSSLEEKFKKDYINDHSKFIHTSWLLLEDLGKETNLDGATWTIVGLWDIDGLRRQILLKSKDTGHYAFEDSKTVARGMGIYNMRNLVTGEEHKGWVFSNIGTLSPLDSEDTDNTNPDFDDIAESGVWDRFDQESSTESEDEEEEENSDPLVKALREDITSE